LTFAQSPADKFLNVTNIACDIRTSTAQVLSFVNLVLGTTFNDLSRPMPIRGSVIPVTELSTNTYSIVTNQIFFKMGPSRFPSVAIQTSAPLSNPNNIVESTCVIVGHLTDN